MTRTRTLRVTVYPNLRGQRFEPIHGDLMLDKYLDVNGAPAKVVKAKTSPTGSCINFRLEVDMDEMK